MILALTTADMSYNSIIKLGPNTFDGCDRLQDLKLASNKITSVDRDAFQGTVFVISLNYFFILHPIPITLNSVFGLGASSLVRLDLSDNQIRSLSEGVFNSLVSIELDINLYQNPIQCDCSMKWLQDWKAAVSIDRLQQRLMLSTKN